MPNKQVDALHFLMVANKIGFCRINKKFAGKKEPTALGGTESSEFSFYFNSRAAEKVLQHKATSKKYISSLTTRKFKIVTTFKGQALLSFHSFLALKIICLISKIK